MAQKILVVDDEPHIAELVKAVLEGEGYSVDTASSGPEALEYIKGSRPDLVILDMMMPVMSGREVCEKIREKKSTKDLRVVFLTVARFSEIGKNKLKDMDVLDYITKPFDNDDLSKRIKKALKS